MEEVQISFDLVGSELGEDIFSEQGILLLKKGTILKEIHILLLQKYRFGAKVSVNFNTDNSQNTIPYQSIQLYVKEAFQNLFFNNEIDLLELRKRYHELINISLYDSSILKVVQSAGTKGLQLYQHSINVGILAAIIGKILDYNKKDCLLLADMGLFHEIGMLEFDNEIYHKMASLNNQELEHVQKHTEIGYSLLKTIPELNPLIPLTALQHHERINGSGYPNQLKEADIPYFVQIISVAAAFNTKYMNLNNDNNNDTHFSGVYELVEAAHNNQLNPAIVIPFVRYIMRQNLHQKVLLNNGKEAQIIFIHDNEPYQPLVKAEEEYIDLRRDSSLRIVSLLDESPEKILNYN
ncbi:HD-GYP domain-containing protein [Cytobacillus massiliigabonensis]|uniref:HD-GYP domain-containing protein n=1 Tax=Cytobacillus massiliigabonensis TaxID=1871011 RepID=UPI000C81E84B|nr:HD domain-containing phosphohydrolase [Cytobacillus massiliigabonensis]